MIGKNFVKIIMVQSIGKLLVANSNHRQSMPANPLLVIYIQEEI